MKISNVEVIAFRVPRRRPGRGGSVIESVAEQTLTVLSTDEGAQGYYLGGYNHGDLEGMPPDDRQRLVNSARRFLLGQDPYDRERFWQLMYGPTMPEHILSTLDMALWDLQARAFGVPVHKLLGGARDRVKAYASTYPSVGTPEEYAAHALQCKAEGYRAYKIHPYYGMAQGRTEEAPQHRSWVDMDVAACRLIREAVGDDMVLMFDPYGTYHNYEEALWVGRELEKLNFYWYEHPLPEYRVESYVRLARDLAIPILSPEQLGGSVFTRADWILRGASDMSRIDVLRGGISAVMKTVAVCEAFGVKCEIHMSGFANLQVLGATSADTCEYYERGLVGPGIDYERPEPYLEEICDPMDAEGYVRIPTEPGMGYRLIWDYIRDNTTGTLSAA